MQEITPVNAAKLNDIEIVPLMRKPVSYIEHPFQKLLDYAVDSLNKVSATDMRTDAVAGKFATGQASLEEVMFAENRATLEINMAVTAVNNVVSSFKEIQQMPV